MFLSILWAALAIQWIAVQSVEPQEGVLGTSDL